MDFIAVALFLASQYAKGNAGLEKEPAYCLSSPLYLFVKRANTANIEEEFLALILLYPHILSPPTPVLSHFPIRITIGFDVTEEPCHPGTDKSIVHYLLSGCYYHVDNIFIEGELAALDAVVTGSAGVDYIAQRLGPLDFLFLPGPYEPEQAAR
jgi:hypothetical protein